MSTNNQDPFQRIIAQEEATPQQLEMLDSLALELVLKEPASRSKRYGHVIKETGATIAFSQRFEDDEFNEFDMADELNGSGEEDEAAADGSWTSVQLYREMGEETTSFILMFKPNNEFADIYYPSQQDADIALEVVQEFLDSNELNEQETLLAKHLEDLLFTLCFDGKLELTDDFEDVPVFQQLEINPGSGLGDENFGGATGDVEIADIIREITDEVMEDDEVHTREFSETVELHNTISIVARDTVTAPKDQPLTMHARDLQIIYADTLNDLTYVYRRDFEHKRTLSVVYGDDLSDEETSSEAAEAPNQHGLWSEHVKIFLDALAPITA